MYTTTSSYINLHREVGQTSILQRQNTGEGEDRSPLIAASPCLGFIICCIYIEMCVQKGLQYLRLCQFYNVSVCLCVSLDLCMYLYVCGFTFVGLYVCMITDNPLVLKVSHIHSLVTVRSLFLEQLPSHSSTSPTSSPSSSPPSPPPLPPPLLSPSPSPFSSSSPTRTFHQETLGHCWTRVH